MRILALALGVPYPPVGGGLTRTYHLLKALSARHDVTLAAFTYGEPHEEPPYPVRLVAVPWEWSADYRAMVGADGEAARDAYERLAFEHSEPWFASVMETAAMNKALAVLLADRPDMVLLEGSPLARFLPMLPPEIPCVLDFFDVHSLMAQRALDDAADPAAAAREAERTLAFERQAVDRCSLSLAVSEREAAAVRDVLGARQVAVVPNGVDTSYFGRSRAPAEAGAVLFTGRMSYAPNVDAVIHFTGEVLPAVRRQRPDVRFHIVGAAPPPQVSALASDAVIVHGRVDDMRPHFGRAEVVVVPVRAGGGTRLKVLEAAASGKAIVSSSLGAEGLGFEDGRDIVIADSAPEMASAVVALLQDPGRREALGANALTAAQQYDWEAIGKKLQKVLVDRLFSAL